MNFKKALNQSELDNMLAGLYSAFAHQGVGCEIDLFAKKQVANSWRE